MGFLGLDEFVAREPSNSAKAAIAANYRAELFTCRGKGHLVSFRAQNSRQQRYNAEYDEPGIARLHQEIDGDSTHLKVKAPPVIFLVPDVRGSGNEWFKGFPNRYGKRITRRLVGSGLTVIAFTEVCSVSFESYVIPNHWLEGRRSSSASSWAPSDRKRIMATQQLVLSYYDWLPTNPGAVTPLEVVIIIVFARVNVTRPRIKVINAVLLEQLQYERHIHPPAAKPLAPFGIRPTH
jgi:hypothetical protein